YGIQQNHPKAIEFFEKAAAVQPENADALYNLGSAYFNSGNTEKGKALHQKAIAIDPAVQSRMGGGK
ncbi:MAG TPA: tetratricopeptide repeat protein, partial [Saprospiraceae bacterium]|nr:tetratricopeptide repeat protein [Saprospiraceae bacterium]